MPDLQTVLARLLEEDGQTAIVGMLTGSKLPFVGKSMRWIAEKFKEANKVSVLISPGLYPNNAKFNIKGSSAAEAAYRAMSCVNVSRTSGE